MTKQHPVYHIILLTRAEPRTAAQRVSRPEAGEVNLARRFAQLAEQRRQAILSMYEKDFFWDVRWRTGEKVRDRPTLAAAAPLYFGIATADQGRHVAARLEREFLKPGGFVTTTIASGQQWDAPNAWPPLR